MPPTRRSETQLEMDSRANTPYACISITSRNVDCRFDSESGTVKMKTCDGRSPLSASVVKPSAKTPKLPQRATLSKINVYGVGLTPTVVFDTFWWWCAERHAIEDRKNAGQPAPCVNQDSICLFYLY